MKFTAEQRERAAEALSTVACSHLSHGTPRTPDLEELLDYGTPEYALAAEAFARVPSAPTWVEQWAEAESWVRTGWTP